MVGTNTVCNDTDASTTPSECSVAAEASVAIAEIGHRDQTINRLERKSEIAHQALAKASHDIRNPLTVIRDYLSIIRDELVGPINPEQKRLLETAMVRADDVDFKLEDLLLSSKLDAGRLNVCRTTCNPIEIVDQVRMSLASHATAKDVKLSFPDCIALPRVYCDEELAIRVLEILVSNSIHCCAHGENIKIWIRHDAPSEMIRIGVADDGNGIDENRLRHMQDRCSARTTATEANDVEYGLDLSVAARLSRVNLGRMSLHSERGLGLESWFDLPVAGSSQLFSRWLEIQTKPRQFIHLISIELGMCQGETSSLKLEPLVAYLTESDELLIPSSSSRWWLANSSRSSEINPRCIAAMQEFDRLRSIGASKEIEFITMKGVATWELDQTHAEINEAFNQLTRD